jgi:peptidoglycan glycosyltransferase
VNKPLRRVAIAGMLLLVVLMINVNYIQGSQADKLRTDPLNSRQYAQQFQHNRGPIMAGNVTLAFSKKIGGEDGKTYQRIYNQGQLYSPITGFVSVFSRTGVEGADNELLDGTDKRLTIRNWFDALIGKKPAGATVQTTIVPQAQQAAYNGVKNRTVRRGAAVALDVKTGAILAMASFPSYDTNAVATHDGEKANKVFKSLEHQDGRPMLNKAMNETFAPGSSFKIVNAAAAIDSGRLSKDSPADASQLTLTGGRTLPNADGDEQACSGSPPLIQSFAASCNSTFGRLALDQGQQALGGMAGKFGFNKTVEVEKGMTSAASVYPVKDQLGRDALARSGIGQEVVTATPLQMAMVAQAVANNGRMMKPYLIKRVTAPDQSELETADPQELGRPISADTAAQMQAMMRQVVDNGTARSTVGGNDIAGKTGTAETGRGINENWFVGFAPQQNPKVAFAVVTEGPSGSSGAKFSAPIALDIVRAVGRP